MFDPLTLLLTFFVGAVSAVLNVGAGGGSSISLPLLIFLGLDSATANGTNRIAILVQNISAVASFRRQKYHEFAGSLKFSMFALPGAIAGALFAVTISDEMFQRILGLVMIGVVISMFFSPTGRAPETSAVPKSKLIHPMMFLVGLYGGFIQVGVGFLIMAALYHMQKFDLLRVNMHKVFIVMIYTVPALAIFLVNGNVHWPMGLVLGAGSAAGGWWAAKISVKKGEGFIRILLGVAIIVMALRLLRVF